ncbi:glycosyltransferase family 4 protein [Enterococcus timonensis]|uniref:glycosyltransferase family 4 protein n=1 Tax=Enterococcus timonensis TaxID=1852364 RepID=UPI0008D9FD73|nr:glycosyltransferase family 4 protein [Enterococcus timonensis]
MKVLLYFESEKMLSKSGIGRALEHQKKALKSVGIDYTLDPDDTYDILHINTYGVNSRNMVNKARKAGKKVIYHAHSTEEDFRNSFIGSNQLSPIVKKYLISLYEKADCLITPTPYSKELLEGYGINLPIHAISNGINLKRFAPSPTKEAAFYDYFHLTPQDKVVICVGLFFERKGIIDFVDIARRMPEYTFIWFGHAPLLSIPKNIRQIVKEDHPENVIFPGYIKGKIIEGAYSAADLFFFPSYEETEGIVVLEALASRQNVLVRDIPVYTPWLKNNENCYMANSNEQFQEKISGIVEGLLPDLKEAGFKVAKERSIEQIGLQLKEVYESVLDQTNQLESEA